MRYDHFSMLPERAFQPRGPYGMTLEGGGGGIVRAVTNVVSDVVGGVVDVVKDVGSFIDDKVIQPIIKDPITAVATAVGAVYGGPLVAAQLGTSAAASAAIAAGAANTAAGLAQGESPEEAIQGGLLAAGGTYLGQQVLGPTQTGGPIADVGAAPGVEVFPVAPPAPVTITPIEPSGLIGGTAGGLLGGGAELASVAETMAPTPGPAIEFGYQPVTEVPPAPTSSAVVPSAFETAISTVPTTAPTISLGPTTELGSFGPAGTAGFGTALPPAAELTAGLTAAGFAPGTAANLAGETAAGVGATNLLGGATAAAPIAAPSTISVQQALRGAQLVNRLLTPQQPQVPNMLGQAQQALAQQGGVDYSTLLGLLSQRSIPSGLLGTQFQPQPINLASLLG